MQTSDTAPINPPAPPRPAWIELILTIVFGFGGFLLASWGISRLNITDPLLLTALVLLLNILCFTGSVALVTRLRHTGLWSQIGLIPPRLPWRWIGIAALLALVLLPVRLGLAYAVQIGSGGSLESLNNSARMDLLAPQSSSLGLDFLVTFVLGGLLAPIAEEIFFRGAIFTWLRGRLPFWAAMLISSALFALGHFDLAAVVATSLVLGMVNAWLFERSHSIWVPITVHIVNNGVAFVLLYSALLISRLIPGMVPPV